MKKVVVILAMVLATTNAFALRCVSVTETGGTTTPQGLRYKDVNESHSEDLTKHSLTCENPGDKECCWRIDPIGTRIIPIKDQVLSSIQIGLTNGSWIEPDGATVVWSGTSVTSFDIEVCLPE